MDALNSGSHYLIARKCCPMNHGPPFNILSTSIANSNLTKKKSKPKSIQSIFPVNFHILQIFSTRKEKPNLRPNILMMIALFPWISHVNFFFFREANFGTTLLLLLFFIIRDNIFLHKTFKAKGFFKGSGYCSH